MYVINKHPRCQLKLTYDDDIARGKQGKMKTAYSKFMKALADMVPEINSLEPRNKKKRYHSFN